MPLIILVAFVALLPLLFVVLLPFSVVQRYRAGTARRLARPWVAKVNVIFISLSVLIFVWASAVMNFWVPNAFLSALLGVVAGCVFGLLGLKLTRWESTAHALHYTPNRPLVLLITIGVAARILYGLWRGWHAWQTRGADTSWLAASGAAGSLAVGAIVLGYYFTYWCGVARRIARHRSNNEWRAARSSR